MPPLPYLACISTALLLLTAIGCESPTTSPVIDTPAQSMIRTELFFGLTRPDGGADITPEQFRAFVDAEITPRFPDGLTITPAEGQWRERSGRIAHEPSRVVMILHEPSAEADRKIDEIRERYKKQFQQEAVMRVDDVEKVRF